MVDGGEVVVSLGQRVLGRYCAEPIKSPDGEKVCDAGTYLDEDMIAAVEAAGVRQVKVRSPLTCETRVGVCETCYGRDLARGTKVNDGEAVGVIAAQSIGEPGTQLTMRTFHIGGTAQVSEQSFVEATHEGKIALVNRSTVKNADGVFIVMARNMQVQVVDSDGRSMESYKLPYGARLLLDEGTKTKRGVRLAEGDSVISMAILRSVDATPAERAAYLKHATATRAAESGEAEEPTAPETGEDEEVEAGELPLERIAALGAAEEFILTVSSEGFGKRSSAYDFRRTGRGGQGLIAQDLTKRGGKLTASFPVEEGDEILLVTDQGQLIRTPVAQVRIAGRNTQGVTIFRTATDEHVVSVERLAEGSDGAVAEGEVDGDAPSDDGPGAPSED